MKNSKVQMLTEGGVSIALALILWYLKIGEMPQGGSISLQMLPLFIFALRWGVIPGMFVGLVYGFVHSLQDMYVVHWLQYLLDYPIAFGLIGLTGIAKKIKLSRLGTILIAILILIGTFYLYTNISSELPQAKSKLSELQAKLETAQGTEKEDIQKEIKDLEFKLNWYPISRIIILAAGILGFLLLVLGAYMRKTIEPIEIGITLGGLGRLFAHFLSGIIFFSQYAPPGTPPWLYSLVYNFFVVAPSTFITLPIVLIIYPRLQKSLGVEK